MSNFKPVVDDTEQIKLIEELRDLKDKTKMTFKEISEKTAENGEYVSESNIKKVFSTETKHKHDYKRTLLPIFNALVPSDDKDNPVNQFYQTRLEIKNETIRQLEEQVRSIKEEYSERLKNKDEKHKDREQFYMDQIEHLQEEIKVKNEQIKLLLEATERKDYAIRELYTIVCGFKKTEDVFR